MANRKVEGDPAAFDKNWSSRKETSYLHWSRNEPVNQIQLAFRRHWSTFSRLINDDYPEKSCLEVGCGRGSLSAYFADAGWRATLSDISPSAIEQAKKAFTDSKLPAKFDLANCLNLPYNDESFGVVFSIGLLEHFEDFGRVLEEQIRVLQYGGHFFGYVVPGGMDHIQKKFGWVNEIIRAITPAFEIQESLTKAEVYRSDEKSPKYVEKLAQLGAKNVEVYGIYTTPMISHSTEFPFSLMNEEAEKALVKHFNEFLNSSPGIDGDAWLCDEKEGQAFLIHCRK